MAPRSERTIPKDEPNAKPLDGVAIRRLLSLARPEGARLALGMVFLALGSTTMLLYPQGLKYLVDEVLDKGRADLLDRAALALIGVFAVQGVAMAMRFYLFSTSGERVVTRLRDAVYRSLMRQEVAFFDERKTGELTSRLSSDTSVLQNTVSANVSMVLRNGIQVLGALAMMLYTSPQLTVLMLAVVPPVALGAVAYGRRVRKLAREAQDALAQANEVAEESLAGIRTVRSFAAEEVEAQRYHGAIYRSFDLARRRARVAATFMSAATTAGYGAMALVLWYGGHLVITRHALSKGDLVSFVMYTMTLAFSLGALSDLWADFMRASGAAQRVFELLDRKPTIEASGGDTLPAMAGKVALEGVSFRYPTRQDVGVLSGVNLEIKPGESVAIVGPSGAGKSTIASLLGRLYDPDEGRVSLDGRDLKTLDPSWLRRQVGVVAQEPLLFSTSIAENIRYGRPGASDAEVEQAAKAANAHDFITAFPDGYQTQVGERGVQLSGGQKQRVAIARAVLKDPRILILDEATSALDAESEHLVQEALERLMQGRTTLIIAHRLSTVVGADRVAVLDHGHVVQVGSHHGLMAQEGLYKRLVERQFVAA
ncbi:MAG TPA: ABC transporter transmembrane domain-containing protein [Myxococcaceae bacterium]|nr:ABC transporter transmembrane domain-containing protein [Myxococcaceae bacterium]